MIKKVPASKINKMYPEGRLEDEYDADDIFAAQKLLDEENENKKKESSEESIETATEDKIYTESVVSDDGDQQGFADFDIDDGNTICPIVLDKFRLQKILPENNAMA